MTTSPSRQAALICRYLLSPTAITRPSCFSRFGRVVCASTARRSRGRVAEAHGQLGALGRVAEAYGQLGELDRVDEEEPRAIEVAEDIARRAEEERLTQDAVEEAVHRAVEERLSCEAAKAPGASAPPPEAAAATPPNTAAPAPLPQGGPSEGPDPSNWECFQCIGIDADLSQWPRRRCQEFLPGHLRGMCRTCSGRPAVLMARAIGRVRARSLPAVGTVGSSGSSQPSTPLGGDPVCEGSDVAMHRPAHQLSMEGALPDPSQVWTTDDRRRVLQFLRLGCCTVGTVGSLGSAQPEGEDADAAVHHPAHQLSVEDAFPDLDYRGHQPPTEGEVSDGSLGSSQPSTLLGGAPESPLCSVGPAPLAGSLGVLVATVDTIGAGGSVGSPQPSISLGGDPEYEGSDVAMHHPAHQSSMGDAFLDEDPVSSFSHCRLSLIQKTFCERQRAQSVGPLGAAILICEVCTYAVFFWHTRAAGANQNSAALASRVSPPPGTAQRHSSTAPGGRAAF